MFQKLFLREKHKISAGSSHENAALQVCNSRGQWRGKRGIQEEQHAGEKKHLHILKQTPNIHYIKRGQSTDYAMLTSGSTDDFSMHPQICRFATVWGLIIKELAVARKAQQKLAKNINVFWLCKGGF